MTRNTTITGPLTGLQSEKSNERLEQIAQLRSHGIANHIGLPQLAVGGDQSSGKSSVLEGITGLPFPRQDGLCTRFPTEIMLTHSEEPFSVEAEIIPYKSRSDDQRQALLAFRRTLTDLQEIHAIINDAAVVMGLRGHDRIDGPSFAQDVLRIHIRGPTGMHLSIVDLPGLISVASEEQTEEDVQAVHDIVNSYASNPRTIILAVVQANNDIANQGIVQKSKKFDKSGQRTVGIITKPDLVNRGTEARIAALAKNQDTTKLKLGFFLLKNPAPIDLEEEVSFEQRERAERAFFSRSPWAEQSLDMSRVGIAGLRVYLQNLLDDHIRRELPKVKDELTTLITKIAKELTDLGQARPTTAHIRMFLSQLAMRFHTLASAALQGDYHMADGAFFDGNEKQEYCRLRACIHKANTSFSDRMRHHGMTMKLADSSHIGDSTKEDDSVTVDPDPYDSIYQMPTSKFVMEADMKAWILEVYQRTRGRELPGNYNHVLLMELFQQQSQNWEKFAASHLLKVADNLALFARQAVEYLFIEEHMREEVLGRVTVALRTHYDSAMQELDRLCSDKNAQPITYNHYYTDNVQKSRQDNMRSMIKHALPDALSEDFNNSGKLLEALQWRVLVNMDEQACSEARAGLDAFYKVARKTFVDNVAIQVIERHLVRTLPDVFAPQLVAGMSDEELTSIGGERDEVLEKRKELQALHEQLSASLKLLH